MKQIVFIISLLLLQSGAFAQAFSGYSTNSDNSFLEKNEIQTELKIFPNPCKNKQVTVELNNDQLSEIQLTNITGKVILQKKIDVPTNKLLLQLENVPNGIYLIQIKTTENKKVVKKLMVSAN